MLKAAVVLVLLLSACAVDTPWAGPKLPDGANHIDVRLVGGGFAACAGQPALVAATSLAALRVAAVARCRAQTICKVGDDECWTRASDEPGLLYIAIMTVDECTRPTKEETLLGGRTLYVIRWIGHSVGRSAGECDAGMAVSQFDLYTVERSKLPRTGMLTVELQVQDEDSGTTNYDVKVELA